MRVHQALVAVAEKERHAAASMSHVLSLCHCPHDILSRYERGLGNNEFVSVACPLVPRLDIEVLNNTIECH